MAVTRGLLLVDNNSKRDAEIERRLSAIVMLAATARVAGTPEAPVVGSQMLDKSREGTESSTIIGTPDECIARIGELAAVGVDYILLNDPWGGIPRLELFAREVMPAFAAECVSAELA